MATDEKVPEWDRASGFESDKTPFWQWRGLPALSMAFYILALVLVVFKVELVIQDNGVLLSFSGSNNKLQERKEDLGDFIQYINAERKDELLKR